MAEDNSDQNIAQPQDGTQQTAPQTPSENVADEAQTSVTEPIAVPNAGEQPTTALPTVDAADGTAGNTADDTPDYASAAGERTVINNATQDAPTEQYRPAPEYGAYGPVPTPPAGDASGQTVQQPQYGAQQQGQPQDNRPSFFGAFGNPYTTGNQRNNGNPFGNPFGGSSAQNGAQQNNQQQPQYGANMPPAGPGNRNPFGAPGQGFPNQPNQTPVVTKQKSGMTSHVVTAVVAALVSGALCLGVGFTAITNGWVHAPTSSSLSDVKSNTSGSGSAKAKSGTAVDWTAVAKEVSDSVVAIDVATSDGEAKGSGVVISDKGYIATNNHVISGAQQIQVTLASGAVYSAKVVGTDTTTDLAVIKLDNPPSDLKVAEFADSDNLAVGEAVMAIGNPLGYDDTATTGIVSALNRPVTVTDDDNNAIVTNAVQIDAAINPGNSGGPTLVGRIFLLISFPVQMTSWPLVQQWGSYTDAETGATPLALMKMAVKGDVNALGQLPDTLSLFLGNNPGSLGEVSALALLLGLGYMLWKKIISWHIPVSILVTVFVFAGLMHLVDPVAYASPLAHLFTGGLMLGAIFMATDYVTSPMTHKGMIIYGVAIGFLTVVIRLFGAYPEGMSFAIFIMNAFTPLINTYCKPKRFGEVVKK